MFFVSKKDVSSDCMVTYARFVYRYRPEREEKNRIEQDLEWEETLSLFAKVMLLLIQYD